MVRQWFVFSGVNFLLSLYAPALQTIISLADKAVKDFCIARARIPFGFTSLTLFYSCHFLVVSYRLQVSALCDLFPIAYRSDSDHSTV